MSHNLNNQGPKYQLIKSVSETLFLSPTSRVEVMNAINSLNNTKAVGYDNISTYIIKQISFHLADILCYLINLSFSRGIFPDKLKYSVLKPLYKKGNRNEIDNYRPIALISVFSKIFEKIMHARIISFLQKK